MDIEWNYPEKREEIQKKIENKELVQISQEKLK